MEQLRSKYKTYVSNIEWHIKTNDPPEQEQISLNIKLDCYREIIKDIERNKPPSESTPIEGITETEYIGDKIRKEMGGYQIYNHPAKKIFDGVCWRLYGQTFDTLCSNEGNQQSGFWLSIILPAMEEYAKSEIK